MKFHQLKKATEETIEDEATHNEILRQLKEHERLIKENALRLRRIETELGIFKPPVAL